MSTRSEGLTLSVQGAEKRDAGRGVARLSEAARSKLGVLSGEMILVEGTQGTVAKVWPARGEVDDEAIRIDADTRMNAGVNIGDTVRVSKCTIEDADSVTLSPPSSLSSVDDELVERAVTRDLRDRPVSEGEQIRMKGFGGNALFRVVRTDPDGPVRITGSTQVRLASSTDTRATGADRSSAGSDDGVRASSGGGWEGGESDSDSGQDDVTAQQPTVGGVTYEDIGGLDDELELVREMIELPLSEPELFQRLGVDPPRGVLLYGPPGTGKTLIAKAVANEVDATFLSVSGPEIMSKYKGESEEKIRERFQEAREKSPAIVFFDEIDSIAGTRDDSSDVENRVVAQLLSLMDGLESRDDVVVIGATNRVDSIDPALRRGGRFDREIEIGVPDQRGRLEILEVHTRGMPMAEDVDLERLSERTHGFVGADLDVVVSEAAMAAIRRRPTDPEERAAWDPVVTKADFDTALASVEPSAMREFVAEAPGTTFADVGGLEDAKATLREAVEWPLVYDRLFEATDTQPPSGVLLYGPPGTGKTLLARALAGESEVNFVRVDGPELIDKYVGESEKAVRKVFERARQAAPSIVFFDEIDAIAERRGEGHEVTERVVSQLLTELDGLADNPNLVVLAATNRKEAIDTALLRPGRLDTHVEVPAPDATARRKIIAVHAAGKPLAEAIDLDAVADDLEGYTGADIEAIVRDASMRAIRETVEAHGEAANEHADDVVVTREHFEEAIERIDPTLA